MSNFFKKLFIIEEEKSDDKKSSDKIINPKIEVPKEIHKEIPVTSFSMNSMNEKVFPDTEKSVSFNEVDKFVDKFVEIYGTNLDKANQPGFDFYEFYQSILNTNNIEDDNMYAMAFSMGRAIEKTLTKDKLISSADFYIGDINKNYKVFLTTGNDKIAELSKQKNSELETLNKDLDILNKELIEITKKINDKQSLIQNLDTKFNPLIQEVEDKLVANDLVKNKIINNMETIKAKIIKNL